MVPKAFTCDLIKLSFYLLSWLEEAFQKNNSKMLGQKVTK